MRRKLGNLDLPEGRKKSKRRGRDGVRQCHRIHSIREPKIMKLTRPRSPKTATRSSIG